MKLVEAAPQHSRPALLVTSLVKLCIVQVSVLEVESFNVLDMEELRLIHFILIVLKLDIRQNAQHTCAEEEIVVE